MQINNNKEKIKNMFRSFKSLSEPETKCKVLFQLQHELEKLKLNEIDDLDTRIDLLIKTIHQIVNKYFPLKESNKFKKNTPLNLITLKLDHEYN